MDENTMQIETRLKMHAAFLQTQSLKSLFKEDEHRSKRLSIEYSNLFYDYSKNHVDEECIELLVKLANRAKLDAAIKAMFDGHKINITENREALHVALRMPPNASLMIDGINVVPLIHQELDKMERFVNALHAGLQIGKENLCVTDVVNLGIGGSDLGPKMCTKALKPFHKGGINVHFVSNVDGAHLDDTLAKINLKTTVFLVSSKSFTTLETLRNAISAKERLKEIGLKVEEHFYAITANVPKALEFGIKESSIFKLWDFIGGRFSVWSSIGLPIAIACGMDNFRHFLKGAYEMDTHFQNAPFNQNIPVIMALLGIWYLNYFDTQTHAILPYAQHLELFPSYIQQLDMESNGKCIDIDNRQVNVKTAPIIWGQAGCNGQHAFHQLLHQGSHLIPTDFILFAKPNHALFEHHQLLLANALSQTHALMMGHNEVDNAHKQLPGNRPSQVLLFDTLTPNTLGKLIAIYEHKIFTQSVLWNINAFDQFGIERGKEVANIVLKSFLGENVRLDPSTQQLIQKIKDVIS